MNLCLLQRYNEIFGDSSSMSLIAAAPPKPNATPGTGSESTAVQGTGVLEDSVAGAKEGLAMPGTAVVNKEHLPLAVFTAKDNAEYSTNNGKNKRESITPTNSGYFRYCTDVVSY